MACKPTSAGGLRTFQLCSAVLLNALKHVLSRPVQPGMLRHHERSRFRQVLCVISVNVCLVWVRVVAVPHIMMYDASVVYTDLHACVPSEGTEHSATSC